MYVKQWKVLERLGQFKKGKTVTYVFETGFKNTGLNLAWR